MSDSNIAPGGVLPATGRELRWFSWPMVAFGIILPLIILVKVNEEHRLGAFLAYLNCVIIVWLMIHTLKRDALLGVLLLVCLPFLMFAWSGSCLYFAVFNIPVQYGTLRRFIPHMEGFVRVQLAVLTFLAGYVPVLLLLFHKRSRGRGLPVVSPRRILAVVGLFLFVLTAVFDLTLMAGIGLGAGFGVRWWIQGIFNYCVGLFAVIGGLITFASKKYIAGLIALLAVHMFIFAAAGKRVFGLYPVFFISIGLFFLSSLSAKKKLSLFGIVLAGFLLYMLLGMAGRRHGERTGFTHFGQRIGQLFDPSTWGEGPGVVTNTMTRLFMTGGHSIITRTPEEVPYFEFEAGTYAQEMVTGLFVPGTFYFRPYHRSNYHLSRYDIMLGTTSVEISLVGHFWMMGGSIAVFIGGIAVGLTHGFILTLVHRAREVSWTKALIYTSSFAMVMFWTFATDFIGLFRTVFWMWAMAAIVWAAVRRIVPQVVDDNYFDQADELSSYGEGTVG